MPREAWDSHVGPTEVVARYSNNLLAKPFADHVSRARYFTDTEEYEGRPVILTVVTHHLDNETVAVAIGGRFPLGHFIEFRGFIMAENGQTQDITERWERYEEMMQEITEGWSSIP